MDTYESLKQRADVFCLSIEIVLVTWLFSGTEAVYAFPMFATAVLCYFFYTISKGKTHSALDCSLNCALAVLIVVCAIQIANPSAEQVVCERYSYLKKLDYITWLPSSIAAEYYRGNALSSFVDISSAICVFIVSLSIFKNRKYTLFILYWFVLNATAMAIVGCLQKALKTPIIYNWHYINADFFGSFPLSNAAGAFLNLAVACAVFIVLFRIKSVPIKILNTSFGIICAALLSYAIYKTESNASIALNILFWMGTLLAVLIKLSVILSRKTSNLFVSISWVLICGFFVFALPSKTEFLKLQSDMKNLVEKRFLAESASSRITFYELSFELIKERPLFGYGGNSCQYLLSSELQKKRNLTQASLGTSIEHAHSDIIEYVLDYGALGGLAILTILAFWFNAFISSKPDLSRLILLIGIIVCILHSTIDMHLHIPSTMIALAIIMAMSVSNRARKTQR